MASTQLTLFDAPKTLQQRFLEFHRANPHVFEAFARAARSLKEGGRQRYGAKCIVERMRFHSGIVTEGGPFKLNNSFVSRLARLLLQEFPGEFDAFLELRALKAK